MMKKFLSLFFLVYGFTVASYAQKYEKALSQFKVSHPVEKIYIQFDKDFYVPGETIWFKAYLFTNDKPNGLSQNLWLQLLDQNGNVIISNRYPVTGAVTNGSISLSQSLKQGSYFVRAITTGMLNINNTDVYKKEIVVLGKGGKIFSETEPASIRFYPESGVMIDGVLTVVGFKANAKGGTPVDVTGLIKTEDGTTITSFSSNHDGIGRLQFKPKAGKNYFAEVETTSGIKKFPLPAVQASGISLKVQDEPGGKKFTLSRGTADKTKFDSITVVAQLNRNVVYEVDIAFEEYPSIVGHLLTDSLPSGVLQMTVFDKYGTPIAERLTFVDNNEYRDAGSIAILKSGLGKREENSFEIQFPNAVQRSMSVAVTDFNESQWPDVGNIESSLLLADNLKDYVWDASWYFKNKNESTVKALDNLLLTQKLKNFDWSEIFKNQPVVEKFAEQHFIRISGLVVDDKTKAPLSGGKLSLLLEAGESTRTGFEVPVGKDGKFLIDSVYFSGKGKVFYGYTNSKGKSTSALLIPDEDRLSKVAVEIPVDFVNSFVVHPLETVKGNDGLDTRFQFVQSKMGEVNETQKDLSEKKREKSPTETVNDQYTTGVFRGDAKETIDNINHPSTDKTMNGVDFVKNRIQQIELSGGGFVNRKNMSINTGRKWAVGIFINEAPASLTLLQNIIAKDIALVKFYEAGFVGVGSGFPGGAVAVYTKVLENEQKRADDLPFFESTGYSPVKDFFNPDYSKADTKKILGDFRSTLYWNPTLYLDASTKSIPVKFYNNDYSKKVKIIVTGMDANGKLIYIEKIVGE